MKDEKAIKNKYSINEEVFFMSEYELIVRGRICKVEEAPSWNVYTGVLYNVRDDDNDVEEDVPEVKVWKTPDEAKRYFMQYVDYYVAMLLEGENDK